MYNITFSRFYCRAFAHITDRDIVWIYSVCVCARVVFFSSTSSCSVGFVFIFFAWISSKRSRYLFSAAFVNAFCGFCFKEITKEIYMTSGGGDGGDDEDAMSITHKAYRWISADRTGIRVRSVCMRASERILFYRLIARSAHFCVLHFSLQNTFRCPIILFLYALIIIQIEWSRNTTWFAEYSHTHKQSIEIHGMEWLYCLHGVVTANTSFHLTPKIRSLSLESVGFCGLTHLIK